MHVRHSSPILKLLFFLDDPRLVFVLCYFFRIKLKEIKKTFRRLVAALLSLLVPHLDRTTKRHLRKVFLLCPITCFVFVPSRRGRTHIVSVIASSFAIGAPYPAYLRKCLFIFSSLSFLHFPSFFSSFVSVAFFFTSSPWWPPPTPSTGRGGAPPEYTGCAPLAHSTFLSLTILITWHSSKTADPTLCNWAWIAWKHRLFRGKVSRNFVCRLARNSGIL